MTTLHKFSNLLELLNYFKEEQICRNYLEQIRWSDKIVCPHCGHEKCFKFKDGMTYHEKCFKFKDGMTYRCSGCKKDFSVRTGTIFGDSRIPLQKWFAAIYLITSHKKGISSIQLHKDLGITQKTAWFLLHRIRKAFGILDESQLSGIVEADETFIGGNEKNKHKSKKTENSQGRSMKTKTAVAGIIERGGKIRAKQVKNTNGYNLKPFIFKNVAFGSQVNTDEWGGYNGLAANFFHKRINHLEGEYVNGNIHTNSIENFWSLLKRGVTGIYHSVSEKHTQSYVDEFVFRYNTRKQTEDTRFDYMLNNINTHLSYNELISKNGRVRANRKMEVKQGTLGF